MWWSQAREVVILALIAASLLGVLSGVVQAINADQAEFRYRIVEFGQQMNSTNGLLMVLAAIVLVQGRGGEVRVGVRVALFRINLALALAAAFCLLTVVTLDAGVGDRLVAITRSTAPAIVLFSLAAWLSRMVLPDPARSTDAD